MNSAFEREYENDRMRNFRHGIRLSALWNSLPLYLVFWLADVIYMPHLMWQFLKLRLLMVPVCVGVASLANRCKTHSQLVLLGVFYLFMNSVLINVMIFMSDGPSSPYYAGLNLVILGVATFWDRIIKYFPLVVLTVFAPYYLGMLLWRFGPGDLQHLLLNSFFIISSATIAALTVFYNDRLRNAELRTRLALADELASREEVIKEKTEAGMKLATLSKQFSPQVVHAIRQGEITGFDEVKRTKICAIFIDIVNSTDRVIRLDKDQLHRVLTMFMDDSMRVFLKYDITVDKFLGDGIVGFSNAPMQRNDYVDRVVDAALEISQRISERQSEYLESWLNEFQLRIGISSGYANVGFYGSDDCFKTYTAIGRVVNLAARLCSLAQPNQILVSQDVAKSIKSDRFEFQEMGPQKLKGFESDIIIVSALRPAGSAATKESSIMACPDGHGILHLDHNTQGHYVFKCRICNFTLQNAPKLIKSS